MSDWSLPTFPDNLPVEGGNNWQNHCEIHELPLKLQCVNRHHDFEKINLSIISGDLIS